MVIPWYLYSLLTILIIQYSMLGMSSRTRLLQSPRSRQRHSIPTFYNKHGNSLEYRLLISDSVVYARLGSRMVPECDLVPEFARDKSHTRA